MKQLLFFWLLAQIGFAQTPKLDSLKRELTHLQQRPAGYTRDTLTFKTLKAIMQDYANVNIDSAASYNALAVRLCQDQNLQKELIYAYQYAGYLYQLKGNYYQSTQFHYKALILAKKLNQYTRMARSLGALAHTYVSLKNYKTALILGQQGIDVLKKHPDATIKASILNDFGTIYCEQGKLEKALEVNQAMYNLALHNHIQWYEAQGLQAIGWVYKEMRAMDKALDYNQKALSVIRQKRRNDVAGRADLEGNILANIADVFIRMRKWKQALLSSTKAKEIAIRTRNSGLLTETEGQLYKIFKNTNAINSALQALENFVLLNDSLSQKTNQLEIEMLSAEYRYEQSKNTLLIKENSNQQLAQTRNGLFLGIVVILLIAALLFWNNRRLQAKNQEIDQQRAFIETARQQLADINKTLETRVEQRTEELVRANQELIRSNEAIREALFRGQTIERKRVALELHDNLSSLLSAVNMSVQAIDPQHLSVSEQAVYQNVKHLIRNAYTEVRNISHNILPAELEREGLAATLTTLVGQLNQNLPIQFSLTITELHERLPVEIEFNAYSIVFELVNNAIRHAKATTVTIDLARTDTSIDLLVADDGIGLGQHSDKRGVGLQNIQTRLDSLGGTFNALMPTDKGTRIGIKIPIDAVYINGNLA